MRIATKVLLVLGLATLPARAFASAFEEHTSTQQEPRLETDKGVSLSKSVLELGVGFRYLDSENFFNSSGNIQEAPFKYHVETMDIMFRFGFTENWTLFGNIPIVWSDQTNSTQSHSASGALGDADIGAVYQFYRHNDPMISMGFSVRWKLPTGNETPGASDLNITGTGTTDVDLSYIGRFQIIRNLSIGWGIGYNIRFPGAVQYLSDQNYSSITNATVDLGDELWAQADVTAAHEWVAVQLLAKFTYRFPTKLSVPDFYAETVQWKAGSQTITEDWIIYNGGSFHEWDVREQLDPSRKLVSNAGYTLVLVPKVIFRPWNFLDFTVFAKFYPLGQNSIYLTDKDANNRSIDNFMPMQTLGMKAGMVLGEFGGYVTVRW